MKLSIYQPDLERGYLQRKWDDEVESKIKDSIHFGKPIVLSEPQDFEGRKIALVVPSGLEPVAGSGEQRLLFILLPCQAMTVHHGRSNALTHLIVQFDHGQFTFDARDVVPSRFRMSGEGCDEKKVAESHTALAKLVAGDTEGCPILKHLYAHIHETFQKEATPCLL